MKIRTLLTGIFLAAATGGAMAYDIEVDGICYNIVDGKHLAVTYRGEYTPKVIAYITDNDYAGDITIPDSVDIGSGVILPVKEIANHAFMDAKDLRSVKLPPTIVKMGYLTFSRSGIETLDLSETKISDTGSICGGCANLRQVYFPETLRSLGSNAFEAAGIEEMTLPDNIQYICRECFQGSKIRILTLGKNIRSIGEWAFKRSDIQQINNMEYVQDFGYEALTTASLKSIVIGADVNYIYRSFANMPDLQSVICLLADPQILRNTSDTFYKSNPDCILWVPDEYLEAYAGSESVTNFFHDIRPLSQVGLEEATAADSTAGRLYDLSGRPVTDPRPGQICITSDGRKVRF